MSRFSEPGSYDEACLNAATAQGLDPVTEALTVAGIDHKVEQTGGFCMVVTVPTPAGTFGITASDDDVEDEFLLVFYPGTSWDDGEGGDDHEDLTAAEVVATIQEGLQS